MNFDITINPSEGWTKSLIKRIVMALKPEVAAALEDVKSSILTEAGQVKTKLDDLKAQIEAGADTSELVSAIESLKSDVDNILPAEVVDTPPAA